MELTPEKLERLLETKKERRLRILRKLFADISSEYVLFKDACDMHYTPARDFYADLALKKRRLIDELVDLEETEFE